MDIGHLIEMGWAGWAMMLAPVLLLIAFVGAVLWMERRHRAEPAPSPLEVLEQRYAQGEIGQEEYDRMHASLTR